MKYLYPSKRIFTVLMLSLALHSCFNKDYDLSDINLKMTLGPNGMTLPLGKIDNLTADSLIRKSEIDQIVSEEGGYAYKLQDTIRESIDAVIIDPIRNVMPAIDPHKFKFTEGGLPESVSVKGFQNSSAIDIPSFDFGDEDLTGISITKNLDINNFTGQTPSEGTQIPLPKLNEDEPFSFSLHNIPTEIASVNKLYFSGAAYGTPIHVNFSLGTIATAVQNGKISFKIELPAAYTLKLQNNYGGTASISGATLTVTDYPITTDRVNLEFYLTERTVTEHISPSRTLDISDVIRYSFEYTGISNGNRIPSGNAPLFSIAIAPRVNDAGVITHDVTPAPQTNTTNLEFKIENLSSISEVKYIGFTSNTSNAIHINASDPQLPLRGEVGVRIIFPKILDFRAGIPGMTDNIFSTTLDKLHNGLTLQLQGIRLTDNDAKVVNGILNVNKPVTIELTPEFPADSYLLSTLRTNGQPEVDVRMNNMMLILEPNDCIITAGFSEPIDIQQQINESFEVPVEVGAIHYAEVINNDTFNGAVINVSLNITNSPVDQLHIDNIDIILPAFLDVSHPKLNTKTNTIHIDRVIYTNRPVTIASIDLNGIRDIPVTTVNGDKKAKLKGDVQIKATVNVPDGSVIDGIESTEITIIPQVTLPTLRIKHVDGVMDIDIAQYLKPTTIDMADLRESLGNQNVEINLVAPRICLEIDNPIGTAMVGNITLQPYDFEGKKLHTIIVPNISIEPANYTTPTRTKLYVTDAITAPEGYTLCRVDDLSQLVKIIPSKIDVSFDLKVDKTRKQEIAITGKDYPFNVNYEIKLPLKFKEDANIYYTGTSDVADTFKEIEKYDITVEDIIITLKAKTTIPLDLGVTLAFLDDKNQETDDIKGTVIGAIKGYDSQTDEEYKESDIQVKLEPKDGNIQLIKNISKVKYIINGQAIGAEAALAPEQYVSLNMKLILKKGITLDLNTLSNIEQ